MERAFILPPQSKLSPIDETAQQNAIRSDILYNAYHQGIDNYSAYEALQEQVSQSDKNAKKSPSIMDGVLSGITGQRRQSGGGIVHDVANQIARSTRNKVLGKITTAITRGIFGALTSKK